MGLDIKNCKAFWTTKRLEELAFVFSSIAAQDIKMLIEYVEQLQAEKKRLKEKVIRYEEEREYILKLLTKP